MGVETRIVTFRSQTPFGNAGLETPFPEWLRALSRSAHCPHGGPGLPNRVLEECVPKPEFGNEGKAKMNGAIVTSLLPARSAPAVTRGLAGETKLRRAGRPPKYFPRGM